MQIQAFRFELFDTPVAPFWTSRDAISMLWTPFGHTLGTTFPPLGQELRKAQKKKTFGFWGLTFEPIFELKIDNFLSVFWKAHVEGLARLLTPKGSQIASKCMPKWSQMET